MYRPSIVRFRSDIGRRYIDLLFCMVDRNLEKSDGCVTLSEAERHRSVSLVESERNLTAA